MAEINTIIKNARDVLVGKVPDPKAQVEQITIALMYKFMDAKDLESLEFGGEASFFTKGLEKYAYHKIIETSNNTKKLEMYRKGLELLGENLELPDIFRTIFKNAYLPYNDPATVALFLKELDKIPTDNTELLGTAFEDLLSIMGSQGDAGQFRTPRHIIDFIVDVIKPQKSESILDPACGTAGFLVSAFSYINKYNDLTIAEKEKLKGNFRGYDISPDMVRLAKVNMFLHGFKDPKIEEYDTLTFKDYWREKLDIILANPPFMTPKGGINPHELFNIKANRSEVLFVDYILNHLKKNGRAGVIVPEGIVFQSQNAYKTLRKELVEDGLYAVVSLPSGVFNPYSGVKTSILLMDKAIAKATDHILFVKLQNDGFDLGAQRRPTPEKNEIPYALEILESYKQAILKGQDVAEVIEEDYFKLLVAKDKIAENGEYSLVGDRYKTATVHNSSYPMVELGEVCEFNKETVDPCTKFNSKEFVYIDISSVENFNGKVHYNNKIAGEEAPSRARRTIKNGDILFSTVRPNLLAHGYVNRDNTDDCIASTGFCVISQKTANSKYIYYLLFSENVQNQVNNMMGKGAYPSVTQKDVAKIKIPLPPLHIQQQIVDEIEGYQKIIDGAKQIVDNYKPTIKMNPDWDMVKLGDVSKIINGYAFSSNDFSDNHYGVKSIKITNIGVNSFVPTNDGFLPIEYKEKYSNFMAFTGDIAIALTRPYISTGLKVCLVPDEYDNALVNQRNAIIRGNIDLSITKYLYYFLCRKQACQYVQEKSRSLNQPNLSIKDLYDMPIMLPPLEEQKKIVAMIELEQVAVNGAKALMDIFEQKIKDKISEVWGE